MPPDQSKGQSEAHEIHHGNRKTRSPTSVPYCKILRDNKIHASKPRLLACRRSSNRNALHLNMKTQRLAMQKRDFCQIRN
ncbi:hypothetical protein TNCV_2627421 [Trichonephila clavipes]|uniref:Uncharacterized protein n=1 Tax=Trichonephila clavipes TaxID=2585209 RepID=A0A8X6W768_TRICX|nr:hypothetical protein TNCV_2627421 [Trichonephila clavipes]